jgi:hypothetical protein
VGVAAFAKRDPLDQVMALLDALVELGPIFGRGVRPIFELEADMIEDGLFHWMVPVFVVGMHDVDEIVDQAVEVTRDATPFGSMWRDLPDHRRYIELQVEQALDVVERCGLVTRTGVRLDTDPRSGRELRRGGTLTLTEVGRVLLPSHLAEVGYRSRTLAGLEGLGVEELLETVAYAAVGPAEAWAAWSPASTPEEKAEAIGAAMRTADGPHRRLAAMALLGEHRDAARPVLTALLETPLAGHAALVLLDADDTATEVIDLTVDRIGSAGSMGPLVDMLAVELDEDPDGLVERFDELVDGRPHDVLDEIWRTDLPETREVLDALGRRHPQKAVAKAARKAAMQHRSRFPG